jgi:ubiquinone/menaquinone biosynthesis C-methylase UbiE
MIKVAQARLHDKAKLTVSDSEKLPFDDAKFDLLTCTFSFHHYPNPKSAIAEMKRVLAPQGKLIIADPWPFVPLRQIVNLLLPLRKSGDVKFYSKKEMCTFAKAAGFVVLKWSRIGSLNYLMTAEKA